MSGASGGPDTPQRNKNDIPDLLRATPGTVSVKDGKISAKRSTSTCCLLLGIFPKDQQGQLGAGH